MLVLFLYMPGLAPFPNSPSHLIRTPSLIWVCLILKMDYHNLFLTTQTVVLIVVSFVLLCGSPWSESADMPQWLRYHVSKRPWEAFPFGTYSTSCASVFEHGFWVNSNVWLCSSSKSGFKETNKPIATGAGPSQVPASNVLVTSLVSLPTRTVDAMLVMLTGEQWWLWLTFPCWPVLAGLFLCLSDRMSSPLLVKFLKFWDFNKQILHISCFLGA